jgi:hypothetical protein
MKKKILISSTLGLMVLVVCVLAVSAQSSNNTLSGWAWSSNIGWISFNSGDSGAGGAQYSVVVDSVGNFSGYAWSPNIGWISFNQADLTGCNGTTRANVSTSTGAVIGWARAIAGIGRNDGWDGCIQLSDSALFPTGYIDGTKGMTYKAVDNTIRGFAWGGTNVGWLACINDNCKLAMATSTGNESNDLIIRSCLGVRSGNNISWSADVSGGVGAYTYYWNGYPTTTNPYIQSPGSSPVTLIVRDAAGHASVPRTCFSNISETSNEIALRIYRSTITNPLSATSSLVIPKGIAFKIGFDIPSIFIKSDCDQLSITPSDAGSWASPANGWNSATINNVLPESGETIMHRGETGSLSTSNAATGIYRFNMTCSHSEEVAGVTQQTVKSGTATLRITESSIIEI